MGSYCAQSPVSGSRKVAMPDSLLTPAPVNTASLADRATARAAVCRASSATGVVEPVAHGSLLWRVLVAAPDSTPGSAGCRTRRRR